MTLSGNHVPLHGRDDTDDLRYDPAYHVTTGLLCLLATIAGALACTFSRHARLDLEHAIAAVAVGLALPLAVGHLGVAAVLLLRAWRRRAPRHGLQAAAYHHRHHRGMRRR